MLNGKETGFAHLETLSDEALCAEVRQGNRVAEEVNRFVDLNS